MSPTTTYSRHEPFVAVLKSREKLSGESSPKKIYHVVLDLAGSHIGYEPGDSLGVLPRNSPSEVIATLASAGFCGSEHVVDARSSETVLCRDFFTHRGDLTQVTKRLMSLVAERQPNDAKRRLLEHFVTLEDRAAYKEFVEGYHVWDFLSEHSEVSLSPQELCSALQPLLPRLYSISSCQSVVRDEVHLLIAKHEYTCGGLERHGVASGFLCATSHVGEKEIPIYVQKAPHFRLPADNKTPLIMLGAGTGVAPYRAFLQARVAAGDPGRHWLFFGQRSRTYDYVYEDFWEELVGQNLLRMECAFSRDTPHKVYVQHLFIERGDEVFGWLQEGAHLYVCGDAAHMAKEVDTALKAIGKRHGQEDLPQQLRTSGRYHRDVY